MEDKKFIIPLAEIVDFASDDIITLSGRGSLGGFGDDPDKEIWGN